MNRERPRAVPFFVCDERKNAMELKDKRLMLCAEMVEGGYVCDIGTDHGYLPAYLLSCGKCEGAIAADINKKPLEAAENTLKKAGVTHKAQLILSDGLEKVPLDNVTDIVIAGMGGELISRIISDERVKNGVRLILQPMTRAAVLRRYLAENGFDVICEKGVSDGKFVYTVMKCVYSGNVREISDIEENIGLLDGSCAEDRLYIEKQTERMISAAEGIRHSDSAKADEIMRTVGRIKEAAGI